MTPVNKARMTFRFNDQKPREKQEQSEQGGRRDQHMERENKEQAKGIPMSTEEYRVIEERPGQGPAMGNEERKPVEVRPLNEYTTDFGGWHSSFDTDTYRIEESIPPSEKLRADPESGYVEREWNRGRGQTREYRAYKTKDSFYYPNPSGGNSWMKIAASVTGAVVTGVAFGFLVLSMFSGDVSDYGKVQPVGGTTAPQQQDNAAVQDSNSGAAKAPNAAVNEAVADLAVNLPAKTYSFLQGGVFSSSQSADSAVTDFRRKGLAAVSDAGEKFPVYVGMALSRDEALELTRTFQQRQLEVMIKPFDIPAAAKIKWKGNQIHLFESYMSQGNELVQQIASQTVVQLGKEKPEALDPKALQSIKATHQSWAGTASAVSDGLGEAGRASLPKMNSALNTAVVSLEEYNKNPSQALLWEAQSALMQYLVAEKALLNSASVQ